MQWSKEPFGGFSKSRPWLPLGEDVTQRNIQEQKEIPHSILCTVKDLITIRKHHSCLHQGSIQWLSAPEGLLRYKRIDQTESLLIEINLSKKPQQRLYQKQQILLNLHHHLAIFQSFATSEQQNLSIEYE